jgi:hypothetical protein
MGAASHFTLFSPVAAVAAIVVGAGIAYVLIEVVSPRAGA